MSEAQFTRTDLIEPDWPAPASVRAFCTTRRGGCSPAPFAQLNLATHVGDDPQNVARNREYLRTALQLPAEPRWLNQVHGVGVVDAGTALATAADAAYATRPRVVCAVLTADCLPVLFCDRKGGKVAAAHAGWRGLVAGVLEQAVGALQIPASEILAWLGPAIGPRQFQVGGEVREAFIRHDAAAAEAFQPDDEQRWRADLYSLARQRLHAAGVQDVYGGGYCTYTDADRFFSYRRERETGRMASLIWVQK